MKSELKAYRWAAQSGPHAGLNNGDIAQLGERGVRNAEVEGSSPSISTNPFDFSSFETPCFALFSPQFVAKPASTH